MMGKRGAFITFEGGEGGGKSTQIARLEARLQQHGLDVLRTREPGGSPRAELIRDDILAGRGRKLGVGGEALLFAAARIDHLVNTVAPALERGAWVLSDRFFDSTMAYQGFAGNVPRDDLRALERVAVGELRPDLTLILDVPVEVGMARAAARRGASTVDRFESESLQFHEKLRQGFLTIASEEPSRCAVVDAQRSPDLVAQDVWEYVCIRFDLPA